MNVWFVDQLIASIRFAGDLPVWLVLLLTVVAVFAVLALYLRESKSLRFPYNWLLPAFRASAVAMVVLILAGPVWHRRQVVGTLGRVIFAVDTSRSMSLTDSQSDVAKENRLQRVTGWLLGDATRPGWIEQIANTHAIDVLAFEGDQPVAIWSSDDGTELPKAFEWSADGEATDLSGPLESVLATMNLDSMSGPEKVLDESETDSVRRSALVLMTDGRDTETVDRRLPLTAMATRMAEAGTTVNTLGFGSVDEPPDLGITEVIHPETVASEGKLAGEVVVKRFGGSGEPVSLRIEANGRAVWERAIEMADNGQKSVPFQLEVEPLVEAIRAQSPRGIDRSNEVLQLVAKVESEGQDYSSENNLSRFRVAASTRNRRLLILDSSSRWETRYLKNLFARDPGWQVDTLLFGEGTSMPRLERGEEAGQFPISGRSMSRYDAILFGEVDATQLTTSDRNLIVRFVAGGGGLIIVDGRYGRLTSLASQEFAELMPVRYQSTRRDLIPSNLIATPAGLEQPALGLIDQTSRLDEFWQALPAPRWSADVELSEGAESWVDVVFPGERRVPWLATRMYGAGRVFYFAADQTWRWRYKVADRFHARFWNQLLIAAMEPPYSASDQFVSIGTDKVEYAGGEAIAVRARLRDTRGNPVPDATVDALVMRDGTVVATVPLQVESPTRGTYSGTVPPLPLGEYSVRIRASGFDESALLASTPIWVIGENNAEMQRMSLDEEALRQIANSGGGSYLHESDAAEMLELLKPLSSGTIVESDTVLWESYLWFWAIIAFLTIEWLLRKRSGLV